MPPECYENTNDANHSVSSIADQMRGLQILDDHIVMRKRKKNRNRSICVSGRDRDGAWGTHKSYCVPGDFDFQLFNPPSVLAIFGRGSSAWGREAGREGGRRGEKNKI